MKTSDEFIGHRPTAIEIPDFDSDPALVLERLETKLVSTYHFNLNGDSVMTDSIKTALEQAGFTHTRHAYFDLVEFIDTKLDHEQLRSNVANSMAWFTDMRIINAARSLFYRDWSDFKMAGSAGDQDEYKAFIENFLNSLDAAKNPSVEVVDGLSRDLVQLVGFSRTMHDAASRAANAAGRDYKPRTMEELLAGEKPQAVNALTQAKLAQIAKFVEANDDGEVTDAQAEAETLKMLIGKTELNAKDAHLARQRLNPIVIGLVGVAEKQANDVNFWELDKKIQEALVKQTIVALKNTLMRLATYNTIEVIDFALITKNVRQTTKELDAVLVTMREAEEQAEIAARLAAAQRAQAEASETSEAPQA